MSSALECSVSLAEFRFLSKYARREGLGAALAVSGVLGWVALGRGVDHSAEDVDPLLPLQGGGVVLERAPLGATEPEASQDRGEGRGRTGDLRVRNGRLSFVLGMDPGTSPERRARYGSIVDLRLGDAEADELVKLEPIARERGKILALRVTDISLQSSGAFPYPTIEQLSKDGTLRMETDLYASPGADTIELVTRFYNEGETRLRGLELGERTLWPSAVAFAPRVGFPKSALHAEVPWLARQGVKVSYALAFPEGLVEAQFHFDRVGPTGQDTFFRVGDLEPGAVVQYRRVLGLVEGDLGAAAELAFKALGRKVGHVEGKLDPVPAWAIVSAHTPDGKIALSVRADRDGRYALPLSEGDYELVLRAPGGEDDERIRVRVGERPVISKLIAPQPGHLHFSITDEQGVACPARIVLRGVPPTKDPDLSPEGRGGSTRNVVFTRSGEGEVELPAGRYRAIVSHGPEYEIAEQELAVGADSGAALRVALERSVETGGWIGADFHLHQAPSPDSNLSIEDRVLSLMAEGVKFAVATDHDHVTDFSPFLEGDGAAQWLKTAPGVEVTTLTWGHFNAYPYPLGVELPATSGVTPGEIFATVRTRAPNAAIQVNHPRMPGIGYFNRIELDERGRAEAEEASFDFDAIEVVNGFDLEDPSLIEKNLLEYFRLLNSGRRFAATGNSDSHRMIINWAGYPRTYVRVAEDRLASILPEDVARAVIDGKVQVSNGIFLALAANGTAGPGETVSGRRVTLDVEARAPSWVDVKRLEVWMNGALVLTTKLSRRARGPIAPVQAELDVKEDAWIVVVARGDAPMNQVFLGRRVLPFAFTNPIFVDADEDGVVFPPLVPEVSARTPPP